MFDNVTTPNMDTVDGRRVSVEDSSTKWGLAVDTPRQEGCYPSETSIQKEAVCTGSQCTVCEVCDRYYPTLRATSFVGTDEYRSAQLSKHLVARQQELMMGDVKGKLEGIYFVADLRPPFLIKVVPM